MENPPFHGVYQERWGFSWAMLVSGRVFLLGFLGRYSSAELLELESHPSWVVFWLTSEKVCWSTQQFCEWTWPFWDGEWKRDPFKGESKSDLQRSGNQIGLLWITWHVLCSLLEMMKFNLGCSPWRVNQHFKKKMVNFLLDDDNPLL